MQKVAWQWLVHDDSPAPDPFMQDLAAHDPRVQYTYDPVTSSIGAKRNALVDGAQAPYIAHFDDDDVYGPDYLARMVGTLQHNRADMIKLSGFYLYAPASDFLGYSDLSRRSGTFFELTRDGFKLEEFAGERELGEDFIVFYGFSYVYRREPALKVRYEDVSMFEDAKFAEAWVKAGHTIAMTDLPARDCLRWIHPGATSRTYSTYRIPSFLLHQLLPFMAPLDAEFDLKSAGSSGTGPGTA